MRHRYCAIALAWLAGITPAWSAEVWKAGVASVVITPEENVWMAGYANRNKPAEGKLQELYAKALALEDEAGKRVVIVTLDLVGIPRWLRDHVEKECAGKYKLDRSSLMINVSHTHCGPVVWSGGSVSYDISEEEVKKLDRYVAGLREKLVAVVGKALDDLKPAKLGYSHARAGFAMNRRLPTETEPRNSPYPDGPVDHAVPVLRVEDPEGKLRAILFGYACHNTTLSIYQFNGDYAGYAQEYLEEAHPGVKALFITGCGGDQNPYPRGKVEQAQQHGRALANAVEAALLPQAKPVRGPLRAALEEVTLHFVPLGRDELLKMKESSNKFDRKRATYLLGELEKAGKLTSTYAYPIQVIQFGDDLTLVALAGEVVVDYSLRLKRELTGKPLWVAAYSNDVFGYVPSVRVLKEGGYEGGGAMRNTRHPGVFAPSVEETIIKKVHALVAQTGKSTP
jgi:hypothetical protein